MGYDLGKLVIAMNSRHVALIFAAAIALFVGGAAAYADQNDDQHTSVQILLPKGFWMSSTYSVPGPTPDSKWVVIETMHMANQSRESPLNVEWKDFVLRSDGYADDGYQVDRKKTASLINPLSETVLGPGQGQAGSLAFLVPATVRRASLWYYVIQFDANYPTY